MKRIIEILYTYSWYGFAVKYDDGSTVQMSTAELVKRVGEAEYERLREIAFANGLTGHWHKVKS